MKKKLYYREQYLKRIRPFYNDVELIKVFTGIRRCGKSTLMQIVKEELIDKGICEENIIYINLDKRPYKSVTSPEQLDELLSLKIDKITGFKYLFIDEVQNVHGFEPVINSYREEGDISIFITGSNSYLLSGELITKLTGRYIEFQIGTLTFLEYIEMKKMLNIYVSNNINDEFNDYILNGGFPYSLQITNQQAKSDYIKDLIDEIFKKDIKKNNKIRDKHLFDQVEQFVVNNFGATMSVNSLCEELGKINGNKPSKKTIYSYLNILENAKIINKCKRFDLKSKRSLLGEEKYYLTDLSLYFAINNDKRINYGPVLENLVYNYGKYQGYELSIGRIGKLEVDFIARLFNKYAYLQVAMTIHGETLNENGIPQVEDREYKPLEMINDNYPKYVLTLDTLLQQRNGIKNKNIIHMMINSELFD